MFVEWYSDRHWYDVLGRFAYSSRTARYRTELIKEAFSGGMSGHWIAGWGYIGLDSDDEKFPWVHKDMVNLYIAKLARVGLLGTLPYLILNILYYKRLYQASKLSSSQSDKWLIWCIAATLVGWNIAMLTVNAQFPVSGFLYMLIAITGNMRNILCESPRLQVGGS